LEWKQGGSQWWKRRVGMEAGRVSIVENKRWNGSREGLNGGKEAVEWKQGGVTMMEKKK
jgi:hypothetical protein